MTQIFLGTIIHLNKLLETVNYTKKYQDVLEVLKELKEEPLFFPLLKPAKNEI